MKKKLFFLCYALLLSTLIYAQITLNQASYTGASFLTYDTVNTLKGNTGIPTNVGAVTSSTTWDFSNVTYTGMDSVRYLAAPAGYGFQLFNIDTISSPFLYMNARGYYNISSSAYQQEVTRVDYRAYCLQGKVVGATTNDSLVFTNQLDTLSSPLSLIKFPATVNTGWSSNYVSKVYYTVKAPTFSLPAAPGFNIRYEQETDSVIGWGKIIMKRADGTPSGPMDVLEVKVAHNRVDSFYLNGTPAPPSFLQPPFLAQGSIRNTYSYRFYRPMEVTPLVEITFTNNSYTTIDNTRVHMQRVSPSSVSVIDNKNSIKIYPNPVIGHTVNVEIPVNEGKWSYDLINIAGERIIDGTFNQGQTKTQLTIPAITPGMYYLQIYNNGVKNLVKPLSITE